MQKEGKRLRFGWFGKVNRKGADNMLKEMPKVGDKVKYIGKDYGYITYGDIYSIVDIDSDGDAMYVDNYGDDDYVERMYFDNYELVTDVTEEPQPETSDILANLARRILALEVARESEEPEAMRNFYEETRDEALTTDAINPSHYKQGDIEVIDYIDQVADSYEGKQAVYVGNVIKYVSRAPHKNGIEDLRKASWYLQRLINDMEASE